MVMKQQLHQKQVQKLILAPALQQAIKEYFEEGEQARWDRLTKCWEAIHTGLSALGLGTVIDKEIQGHLVVTVQAPEDGKFDFFKLT